MADGGNRPTTPPARPVGPRIAAATLIAGVGILVAVLLAPSLGGRVAAGVGSEESARPSAASSTDVDDEFETRSPGQDRLAKLADIKELRIQVRGEMRKALVYLPSRVRAGAPAFVAVHGYTGSAPAMIRQTSYLDLAERNGWIVAFPQGLRYADGQHAWNAGTCCGGAPSAETADVKFVTTLARRLVSQYGADPERVFYHGYSNGAMLGYRVACQAKQPFSGFALLSGTLVSPCDQTSGVPVVAIHGMQDATVPYAGSRWRVSLQTELLPVRDTVDTVAAHNGCKGQLTSRAPDNARVRSFTAECPEGSTVALVTVRDMQHQWTEDAATFGIDETEYATTWLLDHA